MAEENMPEETREPEKPRDEQKPESGEQPSEEELASQGEELGGRLGRDHVIRMETPPSRQKKKS